MGRWKARRVPKSLGLAIGFNLMVTLSLLPVAGQAYDLAGLTGATAAWLRWGTPLFYHWKFGADMTAISLGAQGSAFILAHLGMGGGSSDHFGLETSPRGCQYRHRARALRHRKAASERPCYGDSGAVAGFASTHFRGRRLRAS